jgi:four helix bundle protein
VELETHIQIAGRLGYLEEERVQAILESCSCVGRLLNGLRHSLRAELRQPAAENRSLI